MSAAASPASSSLEVLHQGSDLVTSAGTLLLTDLPDGASVRLLDGAAVVGVEAGQDTARFDFALGQVGAGCWQGRRLLGAGDVPAQGLERLP